MRYRDFASHQETTNEERLRTATLYLLDRTEWGVLTKIRKGMGSSQIIGIRSLEPRFRGFSVDVLCEDIDAAWELFGKWHDHSVQKLCRTVAKIQTQGSTVSSSSGTKPN